VNPGARLGSYEILSPIGAGGMSPSPADPGRPVTKIPKHVGLEAVGVRPWSDRDTEAHRGDEWPKRFKAFEVSIQASYARRRVRMFSVPVSSTAGTQATRRTQGARKRHTIAQPAVAASASSGSLAPIRPCRKVRPQPLP
jgi:hypothetical protein